MRVATPEALLDTSDAAAAAATEDVVISRVRMTQCRTSIVSVSYHGSSRRRRGSR